MRTEGGLEALQQRRGGADASAVMEYCNRRPGVFAGQRHSGSIDRWEGSYWMYCSRTSWFGSIILMAPAFQFLS